MAAAVDQWLLCLMWWKMSGFFNGVWFRRTSQLSLSLSWKRLPTKCLWTKESHIVSCCFGWRTPPVGTQCINVADVDAEEIFGCKHQDQAQQEKDGTLDLDEDLNLIHWPSGHHVNYNKNFQAVKLATFNSQQFSVAVTRRKTYRNIFVFRNIFKFTNIRPNVFFLPVLALFPSLISFPHSLPLSTSLHLLITPWLHPTFPWLISRLVKKGIVGSQCIRICVEEWSVWRRWRWWRHWCSALSKT